MPHWLEGDSSTIATMHLIMMHSVASTHFRIVTVLPPYYIKLILQLTEDDSRGKSEWLLEEGQDVAGDPEWMRLSLSLFCQLIDNNGRLLLSYGHF
jgi:hypothetical protein